MPLRTIHLRLLCIYVRVYITILYPLQLCPQGPSKIARALCNTSLFIRKYKLVPLLALSLLSYLYLARQLFSFVVEISDCCSINFYICVQIYILSSYNFAQLQTNFLLSCVIGRRIFPKFNMAERAPPKLFYYVSNMKKKLISQKKNYN